ncbi:tRNA dimethylallyltransferase isoform X2 [Leptidea sinapis]|uniref:tRNA dimethylallyltransferase isoform X2 n=1 Tax=Leptidea sinapis TaxID=189913 RepID=UPI0021C44ECF|nr:tRNA dimethylallyltransferase isoform X2 [Leptidea sinapis]
MMALRSVISSKIPMVIILGATGTGKTKLSIELAQRFETEIISADSMQIYKGLDIVTAKASLTERELVTHHLLNILEPHQNFTVVDFRNRALEIINNLTAQEKIPIVAGGTVYYIESIVYKILVEDMDDTNALLWEKSKRKRDFNDIDTKEEFKKKALDCEDHEHAKFDCAVVREMYDDNGGLNRDKLLEDIDNEAQFTNQEIHDRLRVVDPVMASRLHPNNRRKVLRSIEVWLKSGRRHSEVLDEQKTSEGLLRRPGATIILWLTCDKEVHEVRLDSRVDDMLQAGLIEELLAFHEAHNKHRIKDGTYLQYTNSTLQTSMNGTKLLKTKLFIL